MRGRGSKRPPATRRAARTDCRSPCGGVDRNEPSMPGVIVHAGSLPVRGAWIETSVSARTISSSASRSPCGGLDRNPEPPSPASGRSCRSPCGGADRNLLRKMMVSRPGAVAPHAGAWIETRSALTASSARTVAPRAGAWIETVTYVDDPIGKGRLSVMPFDPGLFGLGQDGVAGELGPSPKGREGRGLPSLLDQPPKRVAMMVAASAISLLRPSMSSLEPVV